MKKHFWSLLLVSAVLAGCASGVKLDEVPVEDKSATSAGSASGVAVQGIGAGQGGAQTAVASVSAGQASSGQGPVGIAHVVFFDYDSFVLRPEARPVIDHTLHELPLNHLWGIFALMLHQFQGAIELCILNGFFDGSMLRLLTASTTWLLSSSRASGKRWTPERQGLPRLLDAGPRHLRHVKWAPARFNDN